MKVYPGIFKLKNAFLFFFYDKEEDEAVEGDDTGRAADCIFGTNLPLESTL